MLAKVEAQRLLSQAHVAKVLGMGSVLPLNNNQCLLDVDGMSTVSVVEEDAKSGEQRQVAFGLFHRCTKNQVWLKCYTNLLTKNMKKVLNLKSHLSTVESPKHI